MHPRKLIRANEGILPMYSNVRAGRNLRVVKGHTVKNMHVLHFDAEYNPLKAIENRDGFIKEYSFPENAGNFYEVEAEVVEILEKELKKREK